MANHQAEPPVVAAAAPSSGVAEVVVAETVPPANGFRILSESAVYGVVLVSALIIVTGQNSDASLDVFLKVLGTVIVFWVAHVFAAVVATLGDAPAGKYALRMVVSHAVKESTGLLLAALVPLSVILLGTIGLISDDMAVWAALSVDVVLLALLGYLGVARWSPRLVVRLAGAGITALLGVAIMLMKVFIH